MEPQTERPADRWLPTRRSLLSRLKDWGDDQSWQEFVQTYGRLIYSVAVRAGLPDAEAQDVVQETFLAVARNIVEFNYDPQRGSFKAWLLRLTRWRVTDQLRRRQQNAARQAHANDLDPTADDLVQRATEDPFARLWEEEWDENRMTVALDRLRRRVAPRQFQIYQLLVLREWTPARVAQTLGVNRAQVYLTKHRITALLRQELARLETQPGPAPQLVPPPPARR